MHNVVIGWWVIGKRAILHYPIHYSLIAILTTIMVHHLGSMVANVVVHVASSTTYARSSICLYLSSTFQSSCVTLLRRYFGNWVGGATSFIILQGDANWLLLHDAQGPTTHQHMHAKCGSMIMMMMTTPLLYPFSLGVVFPLCPLLLLVCVCSSGYPTLKYPCLATTRVRQNMISWSHGTDNNNNNSFVCRLSPGGT